MLRLLLAGAALTLAACAPPPPMDEAPERPIQSLTAAECAARVGRMQTVQCVVRYSDAGKRCTDGSQCQGDCRAEPTAATREGQAVAGVCQATSNRFGCFTTVTNGKAEATLCID